MRTKLTYQKDAIIVNNFPSKKMRNFPAKGAKSDSIHSAPGNNGNGLVVTTGNTGSGNKNSETKKK